MPSNRSPLLPEPWWAVILTMLSPVDIARAALTCRVLARAASAVTAARRADAAHGLEAFAIPFINALGQGPPYAHFKYIKHCRPETHYAQIVLSHDSDSRAEPFVSHDGLARLEVANHEAHNDYALCCLRDPTSIPSRDNAMLPCHVESCPCGVTAGHEQAYDNVGRLCCFAEQNMAPFFDLTPIASATSSDGAALNSSPQPWLREHDSDAVFECGAVCGCTLACVNRQSQRGVAVRVVVMRHPRKGWGLHAGEAIPGGTFICEYAGERLISEEAERRLSAADKARPPNPHYLMVVWEHFSASPSVQTNIDPTYAGNVGRFMNHACDGGNVAPVLVRKRGEGGIRVGMYARRNIVEGEELCFAYGGSTEEGGSQSCTECCCEAKVCTRKLPRESGGG